MSKDDYDLGKLGTVLAIANQTNRDMLEMLKKQQERQILQSLKANQNPKHKLSTRKALYPCGAGL